MVSARIILVVAIASLQGVALFSACNKERSCDEIATYHKKEVINGSSFVFHEEIVNGVRNQQWNIDGEAVTEKEYLAALLEAEKEVSRATRIASEQRRCMEQQAHTQLIVDTHKKMICNHRTEIVRWLQKFEDLALSPFLVFDATTFVDRKSFDAVSQILVQACALEDAPVGSYPINDYKSMVETLENIPCRLTDLYYATIHNAITVCNDTKILKELLEKVSQA